VSVRRFRSNREGGVKGSVKLPQADACVFHADFLGHAKARDKAVAALQQSIDLCEPSNTTLNPDAANGAAPMVAI